MRNAATRLISNQGYEVPPKPVGAENSVTAAGLVFADVYGFTSFGTWLREHSMWVPITVS